MADSTIRSLVFPAWLSLALGACGGNGFKTGTQTGDEGETPESTSTTSPSSSTTGSAADGMGGTRGMGGTGGGATSDATVSSATAGGVTSGSANTSGGTGGTSAGGAGSGGASSGGAPSDASSNTGSGGVAGAETGSDAPQTVSTSGGGSSGGVCRVLCATGLTCCDGECVNLANDVNNCGACGVSCDGETPYCSYDGCSEAPCEGDTCASGETCCGTQCCGAGELCCLVNQGPSVLGCFEPVNGTCPVGCPDCDCAAPDTPIATPQGDRPMASLKVGDLVYSVDEHGVVVVPIIQVNRVAVEHHHVMRVLLDDGGVLNVSPHHPLFASGVFGDLRAGSELGERTVVEAKPVAYDLPYTYDILPGSSTGAYFAGGALIGSTLARSAQGSSAPTP